MAMVSKSGKMEPSTRVTGSSIRLVAKENSGMLTAMSLKENGSMIKPMDMEFISIKTEPGMRANGKTIFSMVKVKRFGPTTPCMMVTIMRVRSTDMVCTSGKMDQGTRVIGLRIVLKVTESINGRMADATQDPGKTIICMAKVSTLGLTVVDMRASTKWTRSMGTAFTFGLMVVFTKVTGTMENSTVRANTYFRMVHAK